MQTIGAHHRGVLSCTPEVALHQSLCSVFLAVHTCKTCFSTDILFFYMKYPVFESINGLWTFCILYCKFSAEVIFHKQVFFSFLSLYHDNEPVVTVRYSDFLFVCFDHRCMMGRLDRKVIVLSAAAQGIGRAAAIVMSFNKDSHYRGERFI